MAKPDMVNGLRVVATVLFSSDARGIGGATVGIDTLAVGRTPTGECVRVNVSADGDLALSLPAALRLFGSLIENIPGSGSVVAVFTDADEGRVIFLPNPRKANGARVVIADLDHEPLRSGEEG